MTFVHSRNGRAAWWIALCALPVLAAAAGTEEVPFFMPTPEGWRTETIAFPLEFAPELSYAGFEELRFSPGMFDDRSDDYWSYAFVWWIGGDANPGAAELQSDLEAYFRGLTRAVAGSKGFDTREAEHRARIEEIEGPGDVRRFRGQVLTFDAFTARAPVRLNVVIESWSCPALKHRAIFFRLSPQPESGPIWKTLDDLRRGFRCDG